jgi:hypothetical protein
MDLVFHGGAPNETRVYIEAAEPMQAAVDAAQPIRDPSGHRRDMALWISASGEANHG